MLSLNSSIGANKIKSKSIETTKSENKRRKCIFRIDPGHKKNKSILQTTLSYFTRNEKYFKQQKLNDSKPFLNGDIIRELAELNHGAEIHRPKINISSVKRVKSRSFSKKRNAKIFSYSQGKHERNKMKRMIKYAFVLYVTHRIYKDHKKDEDFAFKGLK